MTKEDYDGVKRNRELIKVYREAFGWKGKPSDQTQPFLDDLANFCGLNQAKFVGNEHDMVKTLGRIEVLGRINFFLNRPQDEIDAMDDLIKQWETDDGSQ